MFEIDQLILEGKGIYLIKGTNGTGKSTLFTQLANLCDEHSEIIIDRELYGYFDNMGMMIEGTIAENILFGNGEINDYFYELCEILNIDFWDKAIKKSSNLSLGQKQKVLLARAFFALKEKPILFLDEPFANLDSATIDSLCSFLKKLSKCKGIILISHDPFAEDLSNSVYMVDPVAKGMVQVK